MASDHYDAGGIGAIDVLRAKLTPEQYQGFLLGNVIKYALRLNHKGQAKEDSNKLAKYAVWLNEDYSFPQTEEDSRAFELECKKAEVAFLNQRYEKLLSRWDDIQRWYETADRSAHSWAELDSIMEKQDD